MSMRGKTIRGMVALLAALLTATAGCSSETDRGLTNPQTRKTAPASQSEHFAHNREVPGQIDNGTLWALFYHRKVGTNVKTLWRMSGSGELTIRATGPRGQNLQPDWGPEAHLGSTWKRPGDEWGAGWIIPSAGVWTFWAERADGTSGRVKVTFS